MTDTANRTSPQEMSVEGLFRIFIESVKRQAFAASAPNPLTPNIVSLCIAAEHELSQRSSMQKPGNLPDAQVINDHIEGLE